VVDGSDGKSELVGELVTFLSSQIEGKDENVKASERAWGIRGHTRQFNINKVWISQDYDDTPRNNAPRASTRLEMQK
jgi:hypothetical protein